MSKQKKSGKQDRRLQTIILLTAATNLFHALKISFSAFSVKRKTRRGGKLWPIERRGRPLATLSRTFAAETKKRGNKKRPAAASPFFMI